MRPLFISEENINSLLHLIKTFSILGESGKKERVFVAKITNRDIAKLAGVSPAAVSLAINGKPGISEDTRQKILAIARQHNYCTGTASARVLRERSTYIAALFRTDAQLEDQAFYAELGTSAMVACRERGYTLVSTYITGSDSMLELPPSIRSGEVDGVLIFGDQEPGIYVELSKIGIPFVVLDSSRSSQHPSVYVDYSKAAYIATRHLIDLGHRDIAYLSNGSLHDFNTLTLNGFQQATTEAGIALYPNRFQIDMEDTQTVEQCLEKALAGPCRPTAIFCTVDFYALKVIRRLNALGYRVPEDISIVGIDDVAVSQLMIPSLTTMRVDRDEMIREGLDMLTQMLQGKSCESRLLPPPELILRQTTAQIE